MKEHGILFKAPMVRAILDGRKSQTRRVVKPQPEPGQFPEEVGGLCCPYGATGDRLWVRETWAPSRFSRAHPNYSYAADGEKPDGVAKWRTSIHMPRCASRIILDVVSVRVDRLQDISDEDAIAEGIESKPSERWEGKQVFRDYESDGEEADWFQTPKQSFRSLWRSINGAESWDSNPWVWVIQFRRIEP